MTATTTTAPVRCLVMLIEPEPGKIVLLDSQGTKHEASCPTDLWDQAQRLLHNADAPALSSAPGEPTSKAKDKDKSKAGLDPEKVSEAWSTLGGKLRQMAEDEYGAPVVAAAATVVGQVTEKASSFARRHSRRGVSGRVSLSRRRASR